MIKSAFLRNSLTVFVTKVDLCLYFACLLCTVEDTLYLQCKQQQSVVTHARAGAAQPTVYHVLRRVAPSPCSVL